MSDVSLGVRLEGSLVADEDVKKPRKPNCVGLELTQTLSGF